MVTFFAHPRALLAAESSSSNSTWSSRCKSRPRRSNGKYASIVSDCLTVIFQYHIQSLHQVKLHELQQSDMQFMSRCMVCFAVGTSFDVGRFLQLIGCHNGTKPVIKGIRVKQLLYLDAPYNESICNDTFKFFTGVHYLNVSGCGNLKGRSITDDAFKFLRGIKVLNMGYLRNVSDKAFKYLKGIEALDFSGCQQSTITDSAFRHLKGIKHLFISGCSQYTISDGAFAHLKGIQSLDCSGCFQSTITRTAFTYLKGIQYLDVSGMFPDTIHDSILEHIQGVCTFKVSPLVLSERSLRKLKGTKVEIKSMDRLALTYQQPVRIHTRTIMSEF